MVELPTVPTLSLDAHRIEAGDDHPTKPLDADLTAGLRRLKLATVRRLAPEVLQSPRLNGEHPKSCCAP